MNLYTVFIGKSLFTAWQQHDAKHHADTGQEVKIMSTLNIRIKKKCDLCYFIDAMLLISREYYTEQFLEFTRNSVKYKKTSCVWWVCRMKHLIDERDYRCACACEWVSLMYFPSYFRNCAIAWKCVKCEKAAAFFAYNFRNVMYYSVSDFNVCHYLIYLPGKCHYRL